MAEADSAHCDHYHGHDLCTFKVCCMCREPIDPSLPSWRDVVSLAERDAVKNTLPDHAPIDSGPIGGIFKNPPLSLWPESAPHERP